MRPNKIFLPLIALAMLAQTACSKRELQQTPDFTEINKDGAVVSDATVAVRVEAENYTAMSGVQKETCREGGQNVGYIASGDWMDYAITTTASGTHTMNFRVSGSGGSFQVKKVDGTVLATINVPSTGSGQVYTTVSTKVALTAGKQTLRIQATNNGWNFNWFEFVSDGTTAPVRVEAETYTAMKGVQKESCREGGQNVGYIQTGDYMDYTINTTAGKHKMNFRVAGSGGSLEIRKADNTVLGKVTLPSTGSGQVYTTVTTEVTLPTGQQTIRIYATAAGWNFNWFDFVNIAPAATITTTTATTTATTTTNNILLESTFESDTDFNKWHKEICRPSALVISREVTPRKGNGVARFEFAKSDVTNYNKYVRAEIRQPSHTEAERWYGFSNYLPADFVTDPLAEKIAQWHEVPDFDKGENWRSPPISFGIENGRYYVQILWDAAEVNTNSSVDGNRKVDLGPVDKATWNDWVFHIRFSYKSDGILEIYKNKTKVFSLYGPNSFNDRTYPYFKIGIYKWGWNGWASYSPESKRVLYYDEVRIGNAKSNLTEVSPK
jgi:hypothetical protein